MVWAPARLRGGNEPLLWARGGLGVRVFSGQIKGKNVWLA